MKGLWTRRRILLGIVFLVSLLFILFVGRKFNSETLDREWTLTTQGIHSFRKGLDISGGTKLAYSIDYSKYKELYSDLEFVEVKKSLENIILKNIDARISTLGVSDYKAYLEERNNQTQVVVEIGGIADLDQAKKMIGKTVELEFRLQNLAAATPESITIRKQKAEKIRAELLNTPELLMTQYANQGAENIHVAVHSGKIETLPAIYQDQAPLLQNLEIGKIGPLLEGSYFKMESVGELKGFVIFRIIDRDLTEGTYSIENIFVDEHLAWELALGNDGSPLNGAYFTLAEPASTEFGQPSVSIQFNDKGKEIFCEVTKNNVHRSMAIFIGGEPATVATIQEPICDGRAQISGGFDREHAIETAKNLNSGNMPAPLLLVQEEKVSPSLGDSAFKGALIATLVGTLAIIVYVFFIYGWRKALVTTLTMIFYFTILLAIIKLIDYALSLSGIAAIILSIGMAVDANILIFERMNEEVKAGKTVKSAISTSEARSRSAIRDGQVSTLLIGILLFTYGINMFKGFGSMIVLTALLTLFLNTPFIIEALYVTYHKHD